MGSSAKKKREKKKDFQKPKLKVGKSKPKPSNFTDTSFKAKSIVLAQQSIGIKAPTAAALFNHHLSLLSHKSEVQRRDSLAHLTTAITSRSADSSEFPSGAIVLPKVKHLICDGSSGVRSQLLKLLQALPSNELVGQEQEVLLWIRAGMTHMSVDVRLSALEFLSWLLSAAGEQTVAGSGSWFKTIRCFLVLLKWNVDPPKNGALKSGQGGKSGWTSMKISDPAGDSKVLSKTIHTFAAFLWRGLEPPDQEAIRAEQEALARAYYPLTHTWLHLPGQRSNPFAHLHLFGPVPDEENAMLESRDERLEVFVTKFQTAVENGLKWAKAEQGELGRAAKALEKVLRDGTKDAEASDDSSLKV